MTIVTPPPAIPRNRWGQPMVVPPGGGKAVAYARCTSYVGCIEDTYNLSKWQMRMTALGLATRPDLLLAVSAHKDDKERLNETVEAAKEAAAASAAATTGTALHALTELIDRGEDLPVLPAEAKADLEAYRAATAVLKPVLIEQFCVQDALKIGGTPDRVVELDGTRYIADLKTGSIEYGILKIAMQLAVYARSNAYDVASHKRSPHGANLDRALIIHLPAGQARCDLVWVDIKAGWEAVLVARDVRHLRSKRYGELTRPFADLKPFAHVAEPSLADRIHACTTADAVRALWTSEWTEDLNEVARAHIATLTELPTAS